MLKRRFGQAPLRPATYIWDAASIARDIRSSARAGTSETMAANRTAAIRIMASPREAIRALALDAVVKVLATGEELSPRGNNWNRAISRYATENWNREIFSAQ